MLLYIHGFRSTPNSAKALQLKAHYGEKIEIADFSHIPDEAISQLQSMIETKQIEGLIASSLGGFYATWLSEKYQLRTALINPSVRPYETLARYLGENETYDGERFVWKQAYLEQLREYRIERPTAENYLLFLQRGDEILDYRVALSYYEGAECVVEEGGNHRFEGFERHFDRIDAFFGI